MQHCKQGQYAIHEIIIKAQELFNTLKIINPTLNPNQEEEKKKQKIKDTLAIIYAQFKELKTHFNYVREATSNLESIKPDSLIPYKDDPHTVEQLRRQIGGLIVEPPREDERERQMLLRQLEENQNQIAEVTNQLRNVMFTLNCLLRDS